MIDIMYTLSKKAGISDKDYRMWYKLNEDTEVAARTSVGESKKEVVKNSVGHWMRSARYIQMGQICIHRVLGAKLTNIAR